MKKPKYSKAELKKLIKPYLNIPGVMNIEIGDKYINNKPTDILSIRFQVEIKLPVEDIKKGFKIPKKIGPYPTDVIERNIKKETRHENPKSLIRPLLGGIQIQNETLFDGGIGLGTLGGILMVDKWPYGITNFHVLFGKQSTEEEADRRLNSRIIQPGISMQGEKIGNPYFIFNKELDYALIEFSKGVRIDNNQDINSLDGFINGYSKPYPGQKVFKYGAETQITFGIVEGDSLVSSSISIRRDPAFPTPNGISQEGDSGSIWFDSSVRSGLLKPVGLHYGKDSATNMVGATSFNAIYSSIRYQFINLNLTTRLI